MTQEIHSFRGEYAFLSNFWRAPVLYDGMRFPSAEAAFQAAKTLDPALRESFTSLSPGDAKRRGREVPLRADWEDVKLGIMADILRAKFADPVLRRALLATGDAKLVEGNHWGDTFWGVCHGQGANWLGTLLMDLRTRLREASP